MSNKKKQVETVGVMNRKICRNYLRKQVGNRALRAEFHRLWPGIKKKVNKEYRRRTGVWL